MRVEQTKILDLAMDVLAQTLDFNRSPERFAVVFQALDVHPKKLQAPVTFGVEIGGPMRILLGFGDDVHAYPCTRAGARLVHYLLLQPPGTVTYTELLIEGSNTDVAATHKQIRESFGRGLRPAVRQAWRWPRDCINVSRCSEAIFDLMPCMQVFKII